MSIEKGHAILLASAARTATSDTIEINGANFEGMSLGSMTNIDIIIDVTAITATPSVAVTLQGKDPASGKLYDLLASIVALTAVGTTVLRIGKDVVAAAGVAANTFIPDEVILKFTHADADSITYSVGMNCEFDR